MTPKLTRRLNRCTIFMYHCVLNRRRRTNLTQVDEKKKCIKIKDVSLSLFHSTYFSQAMQMHLEVYTKERKNNNEFLRLFCCSFKRHDKIFINQKIFFSKTSKVHNYQKYCWNINKLKTLTKKKQEENDSSHRASQKSFNKETSFYFYA